MSEKQTINEPEYLEYRSAGKPGQKDADRQQLFLVKESYRTIRTNLIFSILKKGCKKIVFTSAVQGEGKTTTASNVAFSLAQTSTKVLLVDADLRRSKIHKLLKLPNTPGLTNVLGELCTIEEAVNKTKLPNLDVLCSGTLTSNPAEMLASDALEQLWSVFEQKYDYIIIDTPPINVVSDALPIIKNSDGAVLILRHMYSTHTALQKAIKSLEFIDAKIIGVVMNSVQMSKSNYYKYAKDKYGYAYANF